MSNDNPTGKWHWIHKARQERTTQVDLKYKERVKKILRNHFDLLALGLVDEYYYLRDKFTNEVIIGQSFQMSKEYIFATYHVNRIDLFIKQHEPQRIIEIDGLDHGFFDDITTSEQTIERNENYAKGGFTEEAKTLIIITTEDLKKDDEFLITLLEYKLGMDRVR